jgi:transaldolase
MNRLDHLQRAGVSIWLDTLSRDLLDSGAFARLIAESAVTGATSNPTIFAKAITGSDRYDHQLRAAVAAGVRDPQELFFELALEDVRQAADLLRPAYDASAGRDGFVSFECTPDLADDAAGTVEQAVELWERLARANVMIKVPATEAGVLAIEELTARGINVNVTLLFSIARYEQVIDAYLNGLERRVARGDPIDAIASVARPLLRPALARPAPGRRPPSATAVGEHRHQGPRLLRRALRRAADRPRCHQHHARGHAARVRRPRRRRPRL